MKKIVIQGKNKDMVVSSEERPIILRERGGKMAEMLPVNFAK